MPSVKVVQIYEKKKYTNTHMQIHTDIHSHSKHLNTYKGYIHAHKHIYTTSNENFINKAFIQKSNTPLYTHTH